MGATSPHPPDGGNLLLASIRISSEICLNVMRRSRQRFRFPIPIECDSSEPRIEEWIRYFWDHL